MNKEDNGTDRGAWGIVIGVIVLLVSIVCMAMLSGEADRSADDITWVG